MKFLLIFKHENNSTEHMKSKQSQTQMIRNLLKNETTKTNKMHHKHRPIF